MKCRTGLCFLIAVWALSPRDAMAIDQKIINERTKELELMSPVERDRLDRNIQDFKALTSTEKEQYRSMHADLIADRTHAGGLTALMQTYSAWLNSLSPAQRDEVRNEPDAAKKLNIVRRIKEESEHPKPTEEPHHDAIPAHSGLTFPAKGVLDSKDVAAVIKTLAELLPENRLKAKGEVEQPQLDSYIAIINASVQMSANPREWPDAQLLPKMIASIRTKELKDTIQKANSQRDAMIRRLLMGVMKQIRDSIHFPSEEERLQTFGAMTAAERENIMARPRIEGQRLIEKRFFELKGDESSKKLPESRRRVIDLFERLEVQPPPGLMRPKPRTPQDKG